MLSGVPLTGPIQLFSSFPYLRPSFLYPAASVYQLARGVIQRLSQGRLMMKFVRDGWDIVTEGRRRSVVEGRCLALAQQLGC